MPNEKDYNHVDILQQRLWSDMLFGQNREIMCLLFRHGIFVETDVGGTGAWSQRRLERNGTS